MNLETPSISGEYVHIYMSVFNTLGYSTRRIYKSSGVSMEKMTTKGSLISTQECLRIIQQAYKAIDIPYLGLALGNQLTLTSHGMAGVAAMTQPIYTDALKVASRTCDYLFPALRMDVTENANEVTLTLSETMPLTPWFHFFAEVIFVNFYNIMHYLLGDNAEPLRVSFPYEEPGYSKIYRRYFNCPVKFGSHQPCAFVMPRELASRPLMLANNKLAHVAELQLASELPATVMHFLPAQLRKTLLQNFGAFPSLEKAARKLGMSGRTLRRQLQISGTSFQNELDEMRKEFSLCYLLRHDLSITDIAISLGFNDSSAFSRAFKKWTGQSPREYRLKSSRP